MPPFSSQSALPLPRGWRKVTRAGVLHAISVAAMAMTSAWSRARRLHSPLASNGFSIIMRAVQDHHVDPFEPLRAFARPGGQQ